MNIIDKDDKVLTVMLEKLAERFKKEHPIRWRYGYIVLWLLSKGIISIKLANKIQWKTKKL